MSEVAKEDAAAGGDDAAYRAMSARAQGTNVNPQTLLATDYLNHFNEIVMMLEMIPDMPECFEEARAWRPKSYRDHFRDSSVHDRELAIDAYDVVPDRYRRPFEEIIGHMDRLVATSLHHIGELIARDDAVDLRQFCGTASRRLQTLMDHASAIIHGSEKVLAQTEIDGFIGG